MPEPTASTLRLRDQPQATGADGRARTLAPLDAALLCWLALEGPTPRSRLARLLWPDKEDAAARNSLRQRLFQLRRQFERDLVVGDGPVLALAAGLTHDLGDADTVLGGTQACVEGEFAAWLAEQRDRRGHARRRGLAVRADAAEAAQDWDGALGPARELLALEPLSEDAHRRLMRLLYLSGDRPAALRAFDACEQLLKDEVGTRPDAGTLALLRTIEQADVPPARMPQALPAAVQRPPRMVGRDALLARLLAGASAGQHALVVGEAGMGKTRLLEAAVAALPGAVLVTARPGDADQVHALLSRLLRRLLADGLVVPPALRVDLARLVPELGPTSPTTQALDPAQLEHVVATLLAQVPAGQCLVLDDLHFADAASVRLLARAAQLPGTPALIAGLRPADGAWALETWQTHLAEVNRLSTLQVPPLALADIADLLATLGLPPARVDALAAPLQRHTGGNPQFLLETLRTMLREGMPAPAGEGGLPVPATVEALIQRRLQRLGPLALRLARVAAIAGGDFSAELAAGVLGLDLLDLADAWGELEAADILRQDAFAHDLVAEAVLRGVPQPIARPLHARIAQALQARAAPAGRIAAHWLGAAEPAAAIAPLRQAAAQSRDSGQLAEAHRLFGQLGAALETTGDTAAAFEARWHGADVLIQLDDGERMDQVIARLRADANSDLQRAMVEDLRGRLALIRWDDAAAYAAGSAALDAARAAASPAWECDARMVLAQVHLRRRHPDDAEAVLACSQAWVYAEGDEARRLIFRQCEGWLAQEQERFSQALALWRECADAATRVGNRSWLATALGYQALCLGMMGRFREAIGPAEQERAVIVEHRLFGQNLATTDLNGAHILAHCGRFADALGAIERGQGQPGAASGFGAVRSAVVYLALGQAGRSRQAAQQALEMAPMSPLRHTPLLLLARATHLLRGDREPAAEVLRLLDEAQAASADIRKPSAGLRNRLVRALCSHGAARRAHTEALFDGLAGRESHGIRMAALALHAQALMECGDVDEEALQTVASALALGDSCDPEFMQRTEVMAIGWQVLKAAGHPDADRTLGAALDLLHQRAADQVPAAFRDSYFNRVPAHRLLLAGGAQLARASPPARLA